MVRKLKYNASNIKKYNEAIIKYANDKKKLNKRIEEINELELKARSKIIIKNRNLNVILDLVINKKYDDIRRYEIIEPIIEACKKLINKEKFYLQVTKDKDIIYNNILEAEGNDNEAIYYNTIRPTLYDAGSDEENFILRDNKNRIRILIIKSQKVIPKFVQQVFREGEKHCVIEPIYQSLLQQSNNSKTIQSKKRYLQIANCIKKYENIYPNGVPEENMEEIAQKAHKKIVIHDIIGNEIKIYNQKSTIPFHFTNTRLNHVDKGYLTLDKINTKVSQDEINNLLKEHEEQNIFCLKQVKNNNCISLKSIKGDWHVINEDFDIYNDFNKKLGINNYSIDAIKYPDLNNFIYEGRLINSAPVALCDKPNNIENAQHIDLEKAYTQHSYCDYYAGFMGHVQQFHKLDFDIEPIEFLKNHLGIFQFTVLKNDNELLKKLGIEKGNKYTLPSQEILYFIEQFNIKVRLISGCWGSKFNIQYEKEILEKRRYTIWAGKLGMQNDDNIYTFKCDNEIWIQNLAHILGKDNVKYFKEQQLVMIIVPKKNVKTTHHILAFITSYTRINILNAMKNIKGELIKVVLDGIYFRGELTNYKVPHQQKELKIHEGFKDSWYTPSHFDSSILTTYNKNLDGNCILAGQGGSGKSYSVLTDKGKIDILYVVPCHILGKKCREKYNCNYTTIHKLIGQDCTPYKDEFKTPSIIFIDESTMIEKEWIEKAIKLYPSSLIYIAGDIDKNQWYQCRNGHTGQFSKIFNPKNWRYVFYENDYRSKDEQLKKMKLDIRKEMKRIFKDGGQIEADRMNDFIKKNYKTIKFDDAIKLFQQGDIWIAGTHKTNEKLLKNNIVSGYINKNKEIVEQNEVGSQKRGSFTTHSLQGLTLENERVFISLDFLYLEFVIISRLF